MIGTNEGEGVCIRDSEGEGVCIRDSEGEGDSIISVVVTWDIEGEGDNIKSEDKVNSNSSEGEGDGVTKRREDEGMKTIGTIEKK